MSAREIIERVMARENLGAEVMHGAIGQIMDGLWAPEAIAALLTALRMKGETADELRGAVVAMRERAVHVKAGPGPVVDTCGTGGDEANTYNISTAAALVAATRVKVAKHGNRAVSSRSGSADVLEALGVRVGLGAEGVERCIREAGVGFLFAPAHHGAMRHAAPVRRVLGFRTLFNLMGPLTNPAGADCQVVGLYDRGRLRDVATVLRDLGTRRALVVHGCDGLDELTLAGETWAVEVRDGELRELVIVPEDGGVGRASTEELAGGSAEENAALIRGLLAGSVRGPKLDVLLLNAGAALWVAGISADLRGGVDLARGAVEGGEAARTLERLIAASNTEEP